MSDLILSPIADRIIGGLASEAVKQIALIWGVKNDLEELEDTISTIKAVLVDAEEKQAHNNQVKLWLERLVDAVHDADDLVDEFDTEALRRRVMAGSDTTKQVRTFFSSSNQIAFRYKMGRRIRKIKKKLAKVSRARAFHLDERSDGGRVVGRGERETHSFVSQEDVVGRETERNEIVRVLLGDDRDFTAEHDSKENVLIVRIVGMGGLGKTTLAQSAFNDEKVKRHFVLKIWVCVSDNFELRFVVRQIIGNGGGGGGGDGSIEQLQKELRELVGGKRFLLVLDDVWLENREKWLKLKELLVSGADGSRVVVTTRSNVVADVMGTSRPYQLGVLDEENSWSLFKKTAFKHGKEPESPDLVNIARDIASKCGGVPLALRAIGSMLYSKSLGLESWSFFNKEFSNIVSQQQGNEILPTLKLSYNHLPSNLKHCFAYCRLFPKDYIIEVPKLIGLWMAQGFLKSPYSRDQCLEDVGYGYFVDLYEKSFFQEVETDEWGAVRSCKMHDLMHDLAVNVAGLEYETLTKRGKINKNTRHVSFDFHDTISTEYIPTSLHDASKLRTILLLNPDIEMNHKTICVFASYKLLRSLDLHGSGIEMVPDSVGELKHLRYLDLSFNWSIKRLPNSITNLLNLETLKLKNCNAFQELPGDIQKLVNLRHLDLDGCSQLTHMPQGLGQLTNLQTLPTYVLPKHDTPVPGHSGKLKELAELNNLRGTLTILNMGSGNDEATESEPAILKRKQYLQSLLFEWDDSDDHAVEGCSNLLEGLEPHPNIQELSFQSYKGVEWSSWLPSLTNLTSLYLLNCKNCKHLVPMSHFHSLKKLSLVYMPMLEYINDANINTNFFSSSSKSVLTLLPSLELLQLIDLVNLRGWWRDQKSGEEHQQNMSLPYFPRLSSLYIANCPNLTVIPLFPNVEDLDLSNTSMKPFKQTVELESTPTTLSFSPLSKLRKLHISRIGEELQFLPEWFKGLTSLESLKIGYCSRLKDLSPGLQHHASLQSLEVENCDGLISIPECIGGLKSLTKLKFICCLNLALLPEGIRSLSSLKTLCVEGCPVLLKRCQRQTGEDWPKIAHIPQLWLSPDPDEDSDEPLMSY